MKISARNVLIYFIYKVIILVRNSVRKILMVILMMEFVRNVIRNVKNVWDLKKINALAVQHIYYLEMENVLLIVL